MLTGIPQIVNAESVFRKLLKAAVFVFCISGFFYQLWFFMGIYRGYSTVVDMQLKYPEYVEFPSITVCNNNAIQRDKFCQENAGWCEKPRDVRELCQRDPKFCTKEGLPVSLTDMSEKLLPKESAVKKEYTMRREELLRYALPRNNFLYPGNKFTGFVDKKLVGSYNESAIFSDVFVEDNDGKKKLCYTMFSAVKTGSPYIASIGEGFNSFFTSLFTLSSIYMAFYNADLFQPDRDATAQVQVHSPFTYVNPYIGGFETKVTRTTILVLSVTEMNLLPPPYDTACTDYRKLWEENNKNGPLSREMCIEECVLEQTVKFCECAKFSSLYPHSYRICVAEKEIACFKQVPVSHCNEQCKPACRSVEYDTVINQFDMEKTFSRNFTDLLHPYIGKVGSLNVVIGKSEVMVYTHNAKYETVEAFGYLGGYIGIWLGISFIALLDFAESVILLLKNLVTGFIRYRERSAGQTRKK